MSHSSFLRHAACDLHVHLGVLYTLQFAQMDFSCIKTTILLALVFLGTVKKAQAPSALIACDR